MYYFCIMCPPEDKRGHINVNSMDLIYSIASNYLLRGRPEACDGTPGEGIQYDESWSRKIKW